ncbi:MAG: DUF1425 domain-containing protein [Verrucomicrobia bacterium]|jgi:uncharacterized protein YcfL|nr:DUF1425 domain-containing protein [Verrucomicrobiota bacterium]
MNLSSSSICLCLSAILICGSGCKSVNSVSPHERAATSHSIAQERVMTDPFLESRARILGVTETQTPEGFVKIQVELENMTSSTKHIEYAFEWFDAQGNLVPSASGGFRVRELLGREVIYISAISPRADIKDFRVKMIRARR